MNRSYSEKTDYRFQRLKTNLKGESVEAIGELI